MSETVYKRSLIGLRSKTAAAREVLLFSGGLSDFSIYCSVYYIFERNSAEVIVYRIVKTPPHRESEALITARALVSLTFETGNGRKTTLGQLQYLTYGYII